MSRSVLCWASTGAACSPTAATCSSSSPLVQVARKVVGVGSVGTRAWIVLMDAGDGAEPLFLQAKEAQPSVLADYCGRSQYTNQGERVVAGQHLQQAQSDIFLGWTRITGPDGTDRDFYVRQLRDWKFSVPIEGNAPAGMTLYAQLCGWTLARAHARSGDRIALAAYLGRLGHVRRGDRRLRRNLRRPERTRLRRAPGRRQGRQSRKPLQKSKTHQAPFIRPRRTWDQNEHRQRPPPRQLEFDVAADDGSWRLDVSDQIDRTVLPIRRPPFKGVADKTLGGSQPDWGLIGHVKPPEGARTSCWFSSTMRVSAIPPRSAVLSRPRTTTGWRSRAALQPFPCHGDVLPDAGCVADGT